MQKVANYVTGWATPGSSVFIDKIDVPKRTYLLQTDSCDVSIHLRHLCVQPTVMFHPRFRHDIQTTAAFVSPQSAIGRFRFSVPPSGTTCLSTSQLCHHSRFSDNDSRPFCFPVPTKTLPYDSCVTITIYHYCLDTCGHCHNYFMENCDRLCLQYCLK